MRCAMFAGQSIYSKIFLQNLTYEIILTLGQAFEVAYQLALQAQRTKQQQNLSAGAASEVSETRPGRPVPRPRGSIRKSGVSGTTSMFCFFVYCY